MTNQELADFCQVAREVAGIDLSAYKEAQMQRRLATVLRRTGAGSLGEYGQMLRRDPSLAHQFRDLITINVSEFFRNPDKFAELQKRILPDLMAESRALRIWSAGCSVGAEPYSLAMLLAELDPGGGHSILATDIDETVLAAARQGFYTDKDMANVSVERRQRFFRKDEGGWTVAKAGLPALEFRSHNLLADPYPRDMDLVICRNVVIYFTTEAKDQIYQGFHRALRPGGILFVGGTEILLRSRELGFETMLPFFYRARPVAAQTVRKVGVTP